MHVLVTGATGLLGNNIARQLLDRGDRVRVLARKTSDSRPLVGLEVEKLEGDVCEPASLPPALAGVEAVIHSAAFVHIGWGHAQLARTVNVEGTRNVAAAARAAGVRMVHVSSVDALGIGTLEQPGHEEMGTEGAIPMPYVLTKRESEQVVLAEVEQGLDATIVEPAFMLGPYDWKPSSGKLLIEMATRWVPFYPTGGNNFADARDVAAGTIAALDRGQRGRRYILGGENHTYQDAFRLFAGLNGGSGPPLALGPFNRWLVGAGTSLWTWISGSEPALNSAVLLAGTKPHYFASQRAIDELGYTFRPLAETAKAAWEWFKQEGYVK